MRSHGHKVRSKLIFLFCIFNRILNIIYIFCQFVNIIVMPNGFKISKCTSTRNEKTNLHIVLLILFVKLFYTRIEGLFCVKECI